MPSNVSIFEISIAKAQEALSYWTPERKANAIPITPPDQPKIDHTNNLITIGVPFEPNISELPYLCAGKLFFKQHHDDGRTTDYSGSAQFVGHCNIILTAAHCVRNSESGDYYTDFVFSRAHTKDSPGQDFSLLRVGTHDEFVGSSGNKRRSLDYAFGFTDQSFDHWLGLQVGNPYNEFQSIGYPENYGDNETLFAVNGSKGTVTENVVEMVGNPFKHGDSGGAWIVKINKDGGFGNNVVVGLNGGSDDSSNKYSPLFTNYETFDLFNRIQDGARCP
ncbi:trypsin-like serine peptidase [Paenibacillus odorifer]|uniref:trypsin-like serine peptidase n=1 Tax=Paenibacillus odorifer TaxID=189426 RepID=UPI00096BFF59|nr:hypothetical protein [Paenibacillus odorifer]OMD67616.1 hypothetical protein BSK50_30060 [Paenibacillus odorifer]